MTEPKFEQYNDAIVTFRDASIWFAELILVQPSELYQRLVDEEPALAVISENLAKRMQDHAIRLGIPAPLAQTLAQRAMKCGLITAELTRRGYRKFMADAPDLESHADPDGKEKPHE